MADEALEINVPENENERDDSGPALQDPEPVGHPGVADRVGFAHPPDIDSVKTVEKNREPEDAGFDDDSPGDALELDGDVVVFLHADEGVAIRPEMFEKECANGNYAAEGLQFVEEITRFGISRCGRHARSESILCCA